MPSGSASATSVYTQLQPSEIGRDALRGDPHRLLEILGDELEHMVPDLYLEAGIDLISLGSVHPQKHRPACIGLPPLEADARPTYPAEHDAEIRPIGLVAGSRHLKFV